MLRHAANISAVTRNLTILCSVAAKSKLGLRRELIRCAKISSSSAHSVSRKMGDTQSGLSDTTRIERPGKIVLTDEEWKAKLTTKEYRVTRKHGTESAWTGELLENKDKGIYICTCCGTELFSSSTKFDSGSGWPSFYDTLLDKDVADLPAVDITRDDSQGMVRTEVKCGKCDAHLGHVFNDGPEPTGHRYCINSICLKFKPGDSNKEKDKNQS